MKDILFIHYYFPPMGTVASSRNYHLAKALTSGYIAPVLTSKYHHRTLTKEMATSEFKRYPLLNMDYRWLSNLFRSDNEGASNPSKFIGGSGRKILDSFPTNIVIGEGGLNYIIAGYRKGKSIIKSEGIKYIYSSYRPYSDHVIAYLLKRKYPDLIWIADFADLHIDPVFDNVYLPVFQEWCNKSILKSADLVTSVSKGLTQRLAKFHKDVFVVPNGVTPDRRASKLDALKYDKFTVSYTGSLYGKRDPSLIFKVLGELIKDGKISSDEFQLIYAGADTSTWNYWTDRFGLTGCSRVIGLVDESDANRIQNSSQLNILLSWASPDVQGWMTYKVYEYIQAEKPIIASVSGSMDVELKDFIGMYNDGIVVINDSSYETVLSKFILTKYNAWLQGHRLPKIDLTEFYEWYSWDEVARRLSQRIREID